MIRKLVDHGYLQTSHILLEHHEVPRQVTQISMLLLHDRECLERVNSQTLGQIGGVGMIVGVLEVRLAYCAEIG